MNNQFNAFSIVVEGQILDDVQFYEYSDYDSSDTTTPTDDEVLAKAKAFIRTKHVERALSSLSVPVYFTITYGTAGTSATIPTDATIVVGYVSLEAFISTITDTPMTDAQKQTAAAASLKTIVDAALAADIENEYGTIQYTFEKVAYKGTTTEETFKETQTVYLDVPSADVTSTVSFITL